MNTSIVEQLSDIGGWDTESVTQVLHDSDSSDVFDLGFFVLVLSTCELDSRHIGSLDGMPKSRPSFADALASDVDCGEAISNLLVGWRPPSTSSGASLYDNAALIAKINWEANLSEFLYGAFDGQGLLNVRSG